MSQASTTNTPTPRQQVRLCRNFIGGKFSNADATLLDVKSPWTNTVIARVEMSKQNDLDSAVNMALQAFPLWKATPIKERSQILYRFRELVLGEIKTLANAASLESGKTISEAAAGIMKGLEVTEFALSLQNLDVGGILEVSRGVSCEMRREPLGVVAGIAPFNFPAMVPMWMYPIAIALGNCFILKPSEKVPITSSLMVELMTKAGLPPGVFSLVNGDRSIVEAIAKHPKISAVGFVGSTPVARSVYGLATNNGKRALCLGGAKNLLIVTPDADTELTARGVVDSFTGCAGQRCMAASLMIAVGNVDHIIKRMVEVAAKIELGTTMGAVIDSSAKERIRNAIAKARAEGAKILLDGSAVQPPQSFTAGNWLGPTIIDHARPDMACSCDEIFGPVITIVRVAILSEAMDLENNSPYGNATSVFTSSGNVAKYVASRASNGMIGINIGVPVPREPFSFGGTKESKFGHGDITGTSALDFWTDLKKITSKWQQQADASWMS